MRHPAKSALPADGIACAAAAWPSALLLLQGRGPERAMTFARVFLFLSSALASAAMACAGDPGPEGPAGVVGPPGEQGPIGQPGPSEDAAVPDVSVADAPATCMGPCHGFGQVVEQWKWSGHYLVGLGDPYPAWTGTGSCGGCHVVDGLERRVAKSVGAEGGSVPAAVSSGHLQYTNGTTPAEVRYTGSSKRAMIHCASCHEFSGTSDPHNTGGFTKGQMPLRVASGADDQSYIEKSPEGSTTPVGQPAGKFRAANTCVFCHKSRKDVTLYVGSMNTLSSTTWGPHQSPVADLFSGKGAYHFTGLTYTSHAHASIDRACVACHMPTAAANNTPDHSMRPSVAVCKTCHTTYTGTSFDVFSGQTNTRLILRELRTLLNTAGMITRSTVAPYAALTAAELADDEFRLDNPRPGSGTAGANLVVDSARGGALYNYLLIARNRDFGVHNPTYTKQLMFDSIKVLKGSNPTTLPSRP